MIDSKSLMIGNLLQADIGYVRVESILGSTYRVFCHSLDEEYLADYAVKDLAPIPLSSELLSKIEGFSKYENKFHIGINYGHFIVYPVGDIYDHWYLYREETRITSGIRYLHQLQNLYFCLSGNELKLTL